MDWRRIKTDGNWEGKGIGEVLNEGWYCRKDFVVGNNLHKTFSAFEDFFFFFFLLYVVITKLDNNKFDISTTQFQPYF